MYGSHCIRSVVHVYVCMFLVQLEVVKQEATADNISLKARLLLANRLELLHLADRFRFAPWHSPSLVAKKKKKRRTAIRAPVKLYLSQNTRQY